MCGRYTIKTIKRIEEYFSLSNTPWTNSYNVTPSQQVPVVRVRAGVRVGETLRWGLIPFFAKGKPGKYKTHNAKIETMETLASYREPWKRGQRCIQVASGFYEWHLFDDDRGKHPFLITLNDQDAIGFAGLWDRSVKPDGTVVESVAHVTLPANELLTWIHNTGDNPHRMPAILKAEDFDAWLSGSVDEAKAVLKQYPSEFMVAHQVSDRVNSPKNNDPSLLEPVDKKDLHGIEFISDRGSNDVSALRSEPPQ